tara:strand:- start:1769 stop:2002 length:234 start_codon:yes stop_codon:yes gene_type:complete
MKDSKVEKMKNSKLPAKKGLAPKKGMMREEEASMSGGKPFKKGGLTCGGKAKKKYAKGGTVRGAGCATKGTSTAKIY